MTVVCAGPPLSQLGISDEHESRRRGRQAERWAQSPTGSATDLVPAKRLRQCGRRSAWSTAALLLLLLLFNVAGASGRRRHRGRLPIDGDEGSRDNAIHKGQKNKASECRFGDKRYGLEETWNPDLGPPFGVMHCVHCECVPFHKKRRIVGRVRCKNIRSECPAPTCPDPVLLPGRCCKVCEGQDNNPDLRIDVDLAREEEEKHGRHYATLMTQSTSVSPSPQATGASATGRFYFRKKTLSYSLVTSPEFGWPKTLTFLDSDHNIIEEFPVKMTPFQNTTDKVCGTWHRLPRRYRRQLRRDELYVQLTSSDEKQVISGRIAKYYGLTTELFSGLLLRNEEQSQGKPGGAASAVLSVSSSTGSIHTMLLMSSEMFGPEETENVLLTVRFETFHAGEHRIIDDHLKVSSVDVKGVTTIDFKTVFGEPEMTALGHGRLLMTVMSARSPERAVSAYLVPKFSCDLFDTVLAVAQPEEEGGESGEVIPLPESPIRGLAWLLMHKNGSIHYHVRLDHAAPETLRSITIDNGRKSRRLLRVVDDLAPTFTNGWANGSLTLGAADIEALYNADLFLNVATARAESELRGRIMPQLMADAHQQVAPVMLQDQQGASQVTGIAWANMDSMCVFNYQVRLAGVQPKDEARLILEDFPMKQVSNLATMPGRKTGLEMFRGSEAEGAKRVDHKLTVARLDAGDAALIVENENFLIQGRIEHIHPPEVCLPRYARADLELMPGYLSDLGEERPEVEKELATRCLYEGAIYEEGSQWAATHVKCQRCHCRRGKVKCDPLVCAKTTCDQPVMLEGECCPICQSASAQGERRTCNLGDQQSHPAGSRWHPYVPPFGFSRCVTCTCHADTLNVSCDSVDCPILTCPKERIIRDDPTACCQSCAPEAPAPSPRPTLGSDPLVPHDMGQARTDADRLDEGGCDFKGTIYDNGQSWHPRVAPSCMTCKCKDGEISCKRSCPQLTCKYKVKDKDACCQRCAETKEEIRRARIRRVKKLKKRKRQQQQSRARQLASTVPERN